MRINGEWFECDDGHVRPIVRAEVMNADGAWVQALFLVDTGADQTVFNAGLLAILHLPPIGGTNQLGGLGGTTASVVVEARLALPHATGTICVLGKYAGVTDPAALDMSVLGTDLRPLFAFIVDWPGQVVCLLRPPCGYQIVESQPG